MGRVLERTDRYGAARWTAYFRDEHGRERSAGTYTVKREADRAWRRRERECAAESRIRAALCRWPLERYALEVWFPSHVCELSTRESYAFWLERYVLPVFGHEPLGKLTPAMVRRALATLGRAGASADILEAVRCVLGAIYTTAVLDDLVPIHPCQGVKLPPNPIKPLQILTPAEFDLVLSVMPDPMARLLVRTAVESGLRWGELTELRVNDLDAENGILTVARAAVELRRRRRAPGQSRFLVKYPKGRRFRRLSLRRTLVADLNAFITTRNLGPRDLIFATIAYYQTRAPRSPAAGPRDLGYTAPGAKGRRYRHGTAAGYGLGRCRCQPCRDAIARYRATRRAHGLDRPALGRFATVDGHLSAGWFRNHRWYPAVNLAGLERRVTLHDLRHAHASWILEGGASLQVVRERLGHASIVSTSRYLHTLPTNDQAALEALDRIHPTTRSNPVLAPRTPAAENARSHGTRRPRRALKRVVRQSSRQHRLRPDPPHNSPNAGPSLAELNVCVATEP